MWRTSSFATATTSEAAAAAAAYNIKMVLNDSLPFLPNILFDGTQVSILLTGEHV